MNKYEFIKFGECLQWKDVTTGSCRKMQVCISPNLPINDETLIDLIPSDEEDEGPSSYSVKACELIPILTEFNRGYWCALQDAISNGADTTVINSMLKCAGFTYDECMRHIEASDFYKDKLLPVIKSMFPEESKHFAEIEMITWNDRQYPSKSLTIFKGDKHEQEATVSIEELQFELLDEVECTPVSDEAEELDDQIYYYLSKEEFELPDDEIVEILENA